MSAELGAAPARLVAGRARPHAVILVAMRSRSRCSTRCCTRARSRGSSRRTGSPRAPPFVLNSVVIVIVAPIVEELTFRGLGFAPARPLREDRRDPRHRHRLRADHGLVEGFRRCSCSARGRRRPPAHRAASTPGSSCTPRFNGALAVAVPVSSSIFPTVRRAAVFLAAMALRSRAHAAPPTVTAQAAPPSGAAPLAVTLTATGDATTYHWDLGDGAAADGAVVEHTYAAGASPRR